LGHLERMFYFCPCRSFAENNPVAVIKLISLFCAQYRIVLVLP